MKYALAQINPIVADITGNKEKIISFIKDAEEKGADIVIFPEMAVIGYPPMDLLQRKKLLDDNLKAVDDIAAYCNNIAVIVGYVDYDRQNPPMLFNSAAFIEKAEIRSKHHKSLLPSYDVFDETRYFSAETAPHPVKFKGKKIGITICEDIWNELDFDNVMMENRKYPLDPVKSLAEKKIDLLVNISASPYVNGKNTIKWRMLSNITAKYRIPLIYVNQVGGNDSLIFDGNSVCISKNGSPLIKAGAFREDLVFFDDDEIGDSVNLGEEKLEDIKNALILGIRDYVSKCGFDRVVLGLSGGIDSALTAVLAALALGPDKVLGVLMPSEFSSEGSIVDSVKLAENLDIQIEKIPIHSVFKAYNESLSDIFMGLALDITEENIQARIRGNLLMAISNKSGRLLLTTGNKSELAMGYCTLYGDMSGGLAVISDLPKTLVYELSRYLNTEKEIIPEEILKKAPSAELRENQKDEDSLPPYDLLDQILERYIEKMESAQQIMDLGFPEDLVKEILYKVDINEYKRRQAPPGLKVTSKAFGIGRRIPMAQKYRP